MISTNAQKITFAILGILLAFFFVEPKNTIYAIENIPYIIPRSSWGASAATPAWPVEYGKVQKFIIHHTASTILTPDADGSGRYTDMIESIYDYHSDKKTWYDDDGEYIGFGDIGYNYIIDPNGNIYEGRAGGNGSVGGHVRGFNNGSVGISILGRYQGYVNSNGDSVLAHPVTGEILNSVKSLVGWLASANSINLAQITDFHGKKIDGLVGHRDLTPTICPGNDLYIKLEEIQNNADEKKKEYDKYAYQLPQDRAVYVLSDGFKLKYNSQENLPDIYKNKNIITASESQLGLFKFKDLKTYPDGSLLRELGVSAVYFIENQQKRHLNMSGQEFAKMGFNPSDIISVSKAEIGLYRDGVNILYGPDGKLLKDKNSNVYLIENGKKKKFTSAKLFEHLGYKWKHIIEDANTGAYLSAADILYPNNTLVKVKNDPTVYLIDNGQKRKITSAILFKKLGFKESNVVLVEDYELSLFPNTINMAYPNDTLIQKENGSSVYVVENGNVRIFPSAKLFTQLGYKWNNILTVKEEELKGYPLLGKVLQPDGSLIRFGENPQVYLIENRKRRAIPSDAIFSKHKFKWNDIVILHPGDITDYPAGNELKYPNGTLVKTDDSDSIYVARDDKLAQFTSPMLFEKLGNKWKDVLTLTDGELSNYQFAGIVTYPEKTLLREKGKGTVWVMKNGQAVGIKNEKEFKNAGYKWKNVLDISEEELIMQINPKLANQKLSAVFASRSSNGLSANPQSVPKSSTNPFPPNNVDNAKGNDSAINSANPYIRIAIYSLTEGAVKITANGPYAAYHYDSNGALQKKESDSAGNIIEIPYFNSSSYVKFVPENDNVILKVPSYSDPSWNNSTNDNEFRGNIEIKYSTVSNRLWIINELRLEDYVNGIAEASSDSPEEYLKAFGTIARTYAMYYIKKGGKHAGDPFHLKNSRLGNGNDQSYKGYNFEKRAGSIVSANSKTFGKIITFQGNAIVAAYSSDSGGISKNACDVISKSYCADDFLYLRGGINDPDGTIHDPNKVFASHGAGMSAVGAVQMAKNGSAWEDIIKHYYPGVNIDNHY